jgi:tape measure domain-containing protein
MADESVNIIVKATGAKEAGDQFKGIADAADKSAVSVKKSADSVDYLRNIYGAFIGVVAGYSVLELVKGYSSLSDTFTGVINRLKLVSSSSAELAATEQKLLDIANSTRADFQTTADLYSKLASNTAQLGIDSKDLIPTITTVNQLIAISGASAEESRAGLLQFSQALASNRFQGDELRSVLENLPALGKAIAQGLGTTTSGLRTMGEQGQLTTKLVLDALAKSAPEIAKQFATITPTISGAFQVLKNNLLQFVGTFDQVNGVGGKVAQVILLIGNNLTTLIRILGVATAAVAAYYTGLAVSAGWSAFITGINAVIARITAANIVLGYAGTQLGVFRSALLFLTTPLAAVRAGVVALWAVIAANPITAIVTILGLAAAAVYAFGDQIKITANGSINLWGAVAGTVTYLWTLLKQLGAYVGTQLGPIFTAFGQFFVTIWTAIFNGVKKVVDYFAQFIPALQGVSALLGGFGAAWVKAMEDASKATGGLATSVTGVGGALNQSVGAAGSLTKATSDLGSASVQTAGEIGDLRDATVLWASAAADDTSALEAWKNAQARARQQMQDYTRSIKEQQAEVERLALTTRNAMGEMVTATDEWARRSGAAFNAVKDGASSTASAVDSSMQQIVDSAQQASSSINSVSQQISAQSTYLNDPGTVKMAYESQGGGNWQEIGNALLVFNNMYGHPGGDTATQRLWNLLNKEPKEAAHSFVQNYAYVNTAFAGQGLPTFANGGSFGVGGSGGTDSQLVQFMASPDETVTIETPAQRRARMQATGGGGGNVIVNMNVTTPDANSFRRSKNQTYLQLRSKLAGATR